MPIRKSDSEDNSKDLKTKHIPRSVMARRNRDQYSSSEEEYKIYKNLNSTHTKSLSDQLKRKSSKKYSEVTREKKIRESYSPEYRIKANENKHKERPNIRDAKKSKKSRETIGNPKPEKHSNKSKKNSKTSAGEYSNISDESSNDELSVNTSAINEHQLRKKLIDNRKMCENRTSEEKDNDYIDLNEENESSGKIIQIEKYQGVESESHNEEVFEDEPGDDINLETGSNKEKSYEHIEYFKSKFESLSHGSDDEYINNISRSQSSGSSTCSSESFGSSISSSRNPRRNKHNSEGKLKHPLELQFSPIHKPEITNDEVYDPRPYYFPAIQGCRLVEEFECLNRIEEGSYGVVFRARDRKTDEIVALKRLKMEKEKDGFPITSLREINTLMKAKHENIVTVREVVVGSNMDKIYLVMDFVEHDLKSLMMSMVKPFEICEVKCLMLQLLNAVSHLHDNWILHRDLKTSNLLLSHKGILKVADFGLAREYGSPLKNYTRVVVTLWYRAPELLLGTRTYSTQIDMWSVGCIFGELILMAALFPGKSEVDQINMLFKELGTPNEKIWPGYMNLPNVKRYEFGKFEFNRLNRKFGNSLSESGMELINRFLAYCPERRITAEEALKHSYFLETPKAISPAMFPTRPAKSEGGVVGRPKQASSPKPPSGGQILKNLNDDRLFIR